MCSEGGDLFVYQASSHKQLFERTLLIPGQDGEGENEITSIVYCAEMNTVVVSTFSGTILCFEDQPSDIEEWDCTGFVDQTKCFLPVKNFVTLTHCINTIIAIPTNEEDTFQVVTVALFVVNRVDCLFVCLFVCLFICLYSGLSLINTNTDKANKV